MTNKIITSGITDPSRLMPFTAPTLDFIQDTLAEFAAQWAISMYGPGQSQIAPLMITTRKTGTVWSSGLWFGGGLVPFVFWFDGGDTAGMTNPKAVLTDYYYTTSSNINGAGDRPWYANSGIADPLTFTDNVQRSVHRIRKCVLQDTTGTGPLGIALDLNSTLQQWVQHQSSTVSPTGAWTGSLGYRYSSTRGTVVLQGTLNILGSGGYTLPIEVRPAATRNVSVTIVDDGTYKAGICTIDTSGAVTFSGNLSGTSTRVAYMDGVEYMIPN